MTDSTKVNAAAIFKVALIITVALSGCVGQAAPSPDGDCEPKGQIPLTRVELKTEDPVLQKLFDNAVAAAAGNVKEFAPGFRVIIEGAGYEKVYLETQPMGGEMYAKHNLEIGKNNQVVFMKAQRKDGRLPGSVAPEGFNVPRSHLSFAMEVGPMTAFYGNLQGYCFPAPAFNIYYLLGKDKEYLQELYNTLEAFDEYLWRTRDSDGNGILELWCMFDAGEDDSTRLESQPRYWPHDYPPDKRAWLDRLGAADETAVLERYLRNSPEWIVPIESMDVTSYSYSGRDILAQISRELNNGKEQYWREKAEDVRKNLIDYLWRPEKHACYDRDKNNDFLETLIHNNLRVMYYGAFTQEMADEFIRYHLLNPEEFWTTMPLPSIAVNDPLFRNVPAEIHDDWSGPPMALTYQRSIRALENYGHWAELTLIAQKFIDKAGQACKFGMNFDPFTGKMSASRNRWDYGPMILSTLEFISRLYGIHVEREDVYFSGITRGNHRLEYTQRLGDIEYSIENGGGGFKGSINGEEIFRCTSGVRVVTDLHGTVQQVAGIDGVDHDVVLTIRGQEYKITVKPNRSYGFDGDGRLKESGSVPFDYPYKEPATN